MSSVPLSQDVASTLNVQVVLAILGGIAMMLALMGSIEFQGKLVIPKMPSWSRFLSGIAGVILIGVAIWLSFPNSTPVTPATSGETATPNQAPTDTPKETELPSATAALVPTDTLAPTITPTKTTPPQPLPEIFPQIDGGQEFVFINNDGSLVNEFTMDQNCSHTGSYGLRLKYAMKGDGNGGWGVHWDNAPLKYFDATHFSTVIFWVKGTAGHETFQVGLRDIDGKESKVETKILLVLSAEWMELKIPLSKFTGVNTDLIKNINFGFNKNHGSGTICIDDITFVP
jgi:hypothetical protein